MTRASVIYGADERLLPWAEAHIPFVTFSPDAHAIGIERDGRLRGVCVFDRFGDGDCLVHIASDGSRRWFSREFATRCMAYPFTQLRQRRITALVASTNHASLRFVRGFGGWVHEGTMRDGASEGVDFLIFGMLRQDCRFLPQNNERLYHRVQLV